MKKILYILIFFIILGDNLMSAHIEKIKIDNTEVPIIFEKQTSLPTFNFQLVFQNSGYVKDGNLSGLATISAKVLNEGTKQLGSSKFANELEKRAISIGSSVGYETFVIEVSSLKEEKKDAIKLLKDLLSDPNITQETLEKIKTIQIGSLKRKENDYDSVAKKELMSLVFVNTPLATPQSGMIESIEKIKLENVKEFINNALSLENLIVVAGGDISLDSIKDDIVEISQLLNNHKNIALNNYNARYDAKTITLEKETEQAYIYFASPLEIKSDDENTHLAKVASFVLGGSGFGSRLMEEIRVKRGLAYSAYAYFSMNKSYSYFTGYLQTKLQSTDEAIDIVKEEIAKFIDKGITQKELDSAINFITGSEPLRTETLSQRLSRAFTLYYKGLSLDYPMKELEKIKNIKLDEINKFIKEHDEINNLSFSIVRK